MVSINSDAFFKTDMDDVVAGNESRFKPVRNYLAGEKVIGFVSGKTNTPVEETVHYFIAQYTLAPVLVEHGPNRRLVIVDLQNDQLNIERLNPNLEIVKYLGSGVTLYRNRLVK